MKSDPSTQTSLRARRCLQIGIVLSVTAATCLLLIKRMAQVGNWLPPLPVAIGSWEAITIPMGDDTRNILGNPPVDGREYRNPLEDKVMVQLVVPKTFDAYREPPDMTKFFGITAQRVLPLFGPGKPVRAWVWKGRNNDKVKAMMFCWIQERDGGTRVFGLRGLQQTFWERLLISKDSLLDGQDRCIVRVYTMVHSSDKNGAQARRNLEEVARGIYASARKGATP